MNENSTPRTGRTASATRKIGLRPTPRAEARPTHQATPTITNWAAMMQADSAMASSPGCVLRQHLPGHRQHRRVAEMEQHHRGEKDQQVAPLAAGRGTGSARACWRVLAAARLLVVDFRRVDQG